ncbi:Arm DNA-binding domain-containing protein [Salinibacterium sp. CAN_S4]|uniref:Arm DNA-binding domain-containing protein n=1 Tax=Salinibacterium sp. CAN_S4 TaxID=2787727 RepID=UPI0018F000A7
MGSISAYTTASGKRYRVIYRRPDRLQTQKRGFKTKRDAELFLAKAADPAGVRPHENGLAAS